MEAQDPKLEEIKIENYSKLTVGDLENFILENKDSLCNCWLRDSSFNCTCMPTHKFLLLMACTTLPPIITVGTWLCVQNCGSAAKQCQKSCDHIRYDNIYQACINGCPDANEKIDDNRCNTGIGVLASTVPVTLALTGIAKLCVWGFEKITGTRNKKILGQIKEKYFHDRDEVDQVSDQEIAPWAKVLMKEKSQLLKKIGQNRNQCLVLFQKDILLFESLMKEGYFADIAPLIQGLKKFTTMTDLELLKELEVCEIGGCLVDTQIWETLVHILVKRNQNTEVDAKLMEMLRKIRPDIATNHDFNNKMFLDEVIKYGSVDQALKSSAKTNCEKL